MGFYTLINSISVISGQWTGDNERLCAMEQGSIAHSLSVSHKSCIPPHCHYVPKLKMGCFSFVMYSADLQLKIFAERTQQ